MGILFAFLALVFWGFGDFLIQKSTRKFGDWVALFYITAFATVLTFPLIYKDLLALGSHPRQLGLLVLASVVILFAAILDFEALRKGKISIIEPIFALEIPVTAVLASLVIGERLTWWQVLFIVLLMVGLALVSVKSLHVLKKARWERGVWLAFFATIAMGAVNFLFGEGARETSPFLFNWFISAFISIVVILYLFSQSRLSEIGRDWRLDKKLLLSVAALDNAAWISYSYSALYIPLAIATSLSEGFILVAGLLGLALNKEKLKRHQLLGFILAVVSVIMLAAITDG